MMQMLFTKANMNMKMLQFIGKAFPSLGNSLEVLNDPLELHLAVHDIVAILVRGLEEDHGSGIAGENELLRLDTTEAGQEGTESIPSGGNGYGEVDADGGLGSGIPSSLFGTEATSEMLDLRYEAEVQGGEGA